MNKKELGQYFTTSDILKKELYSFILNDAHTILEPSIGQGDLVSYINKKKSVLFDMYEIDDTINFLPDINIDEIIFGDFLTQNIDKKYKTIVGNPPYVKIKKANNVYIMFIEKCFNLLDEEGELIFIVPSDFFKLTSTTNLIKKMLEEGTFTHIFHPNNEKLFTEASIDVIIFRYCKNKNLDNKLIYNNKTKFLTNSNGNLTFNDTNITSINTLSDYFDIYVGMVSGKENVFKNIIGNVRILNNENKYDTYILTHTFPSNNTQIDKFLLSHKPELLERKIRKFTEKNWFEWGALRNIKIVEKNLGKDCIYIHTLTRKKTVAFKHTVDYFGGGLIMLKPKNNINLDKIVKYINSDTFKNHFIFSGRFKIGHKQLSNCLIDNSLFI